MNDIVGTWRLVASFAHDENGERMRASYGPTPMGLVMFHPTGRMMCVLCDGRPQVPSADGDREYVSYAGQYTFDGSTLITRVDNTSDAARMGGDEIRQVRFEGGQLVLTPPPRPRDGKMQHRELIWEWIA